jgi:hypothetical protein
LLSPNRWLELQSIRIGAFSTAEPVRSNVSAGSPQAIKVEISPLAVIVSLLTLKVPPIELQPKRALMRPLLKLMP